MSLRANVTIPLFGSCSNESILDLSVGVYGTFDSRLLTFYISPRRSSYFPSNYIFFLFSFTRKKKCLNLQNFKLCFFLLSKGEEKFDLAGKGHPQSGFILCLWNWTQVCQLYLNPIVKNSVIYEFS